MPCNHDNTEDTFVVGGPENIANGHDSPTADFINVSHFPLVHEYQNLSPRNRPQFDNGGNDVSRGSDNVEYDVSSSAHLNASVSQSTVSTYYTEFVFQMDYFKTGSLSAYTCVHTDDLCGICWRQNTAFYPLSLATFVLGTHLSRRQFGTHVSLNDVRSGRTITVCGLCRQYFQKNVWSYAWPAVFCTLIFFPGKYKINGQYFYTLLPPELRASWEKAASQNFPLPDGNTHLFEDFGLKYQEFTALLAQYKCHNLKFLLDKFAFPFIKCPAGCSALIGCCSNVSFVHVLNLLIPDFVSFGADCKKIRAIRSDFFQSSNHLDSFICAPHLEVNTKGVFLKTCRVHNVLNKNMIHVPTSPLGNLLHPFADRFSLLNSKPRNVTPMKVGTFSHTYTLATSKGGYDGISSLQLTSLRCYNVKSDNLLPRNESLVYNNRKDVRSLLTHLLNSNEINEDFFNSIARNVAPVPAELITHHVSSGSKLSLFSLASIKLYLDSTFSKTFSIPPSLLLLHSDHNHGIQPYSFSKVFCQIHFAVSIIVFFHSHLEFLGHCLLENINSQKYIATLSKFANSSSKPPGVNSTATAKLMDEFVTFFAMPNFVTSNFLSIMNYFFEINNSSACYYLPQRNLIRNNVTDLFHEIRNASISMFAVICSEDDSRASPFPLLVQTNDNIYSLLLALAEDSMTFVFRYSPTFEGWWHVHCPSFQSFKEDQRILHRSNRTWNLLIYQSLDHPLSAATKSLLFFGGQNIFKCTCHRLPFTVDTKLSKFSCSINRCNKKSAWRCPSDSCPGSVCANHFKTLSEQYDEFFIDAPPLPCPDSQSSVVSSTSTGSQSQSISPSTAASITARDSTSSELFVGIEETGFPFESFGETEATTHLPIVQEPEHSHAPFHLLLNGILGAFKRPQSPLQLSKKYLRFFQNLVACHPGQVVSLLQAEAMMSPSVFYHQQKDGSFTGAMPYFLLGDDKDNSTYGFHGFYQHAIARVTNLELSVSSNINYLFFLTDVLLNISLQKTLTQEFFKRGVHNIEIRGNKLQSPPSSIGFSLVDSERNIAELGEAMRTEKPALFVTLTLNMRHHFGISPMLRAIEKVFPDKTSEQYKAAVQLHMPIMIQMWNETIQHLIDYLLHSSEHILGHIAKIWGRAEFQDAVANFPHYHFLLWLSDSEDTIKRMILSTKKHVLHAFRNLFHSNLQLIETWNDVEILFDLFVRVQSHDCDAINKRCHKTDLLSGISKCRFPPYPPSEDFWLKTIPQKYSNPAAVILKKLNLVNYIDDFNYSAGSQLQCQKYQYPATKGEHLMPNSPTLFALTLSSGNVQMITETFCSKYLNKYAAGKEEHASVHIKPGTTDNAFSVTAPEIQNLKITGAAKRKDFEEKKKRPTASISALQVSQTEFLWWMLKLPIVITNIHFVHVPSIALEFRGGILHKCSNERRPAGASNDLLTVREQLNFPTYNCFTQRQKTHIEDALKSPFYIDRITLFSIRPPELFFVRQLNNYYKFFVRCPPAKKLNSFSLLVKNPRPWVDGTGCVVRIRSTALELLQQWLTTVQDQSNPLLGQFKVILQNLHTHDYKETYVCDTTNLSPCPPEVVFSKVTPKNASKFLLHLLYTMGSFDTELDLFASTSLRQCFVDAGILHSTSSFTQSDADDLLTRYITEELKFLPGGNTAFSNRLVLAAQSIENLVLNDTISNNCIPEVLMTNLTDQCERSITSFLTETQDRLYQRLKPVNVTNIPQQYPQQPIGHWVPVFTKLPIQSDRSFNEQASIIDKLLLVLDSYIQTRLVQKNQIVLGKPGSGKSHLTSICLLYGMLNGLFCYVTGLASRRAQHFNCLHIHRLFCINPNDRANVTLAVEKALKKLHHHAERKALLMSLDVLVLEEIGIISSQLLATVDLILQKVRDSSLLFGGVLIIANGDTNQLPNIDGSDVFLCTTLLFCFDIHFLTTLVRMLDPIGQELLDLMTQRPIPEHDVLRIASIISQNCTFVPSWNDLTDYTTMKVFGRKDAEREAMDRYQIAVSSSGEPFVQYVADDEICNDSSVQWVPASDEATKFLDRECREPRKVVLKKHSVVRLTVNTDSFSQGQIGIVAELPSNAQPFYYYTLPQK